MSRRQQRGHSDREHLRRLAERLGLSSVDMAYFDAVHDFVRALGTRILNGSDDGAERFAVLMAIVSKSTRAQLINAARRHTGRPTVGLADAEVSERANAITKWAVWVARLEGANDVGPECW